MRGGGAGEGLGRGMVGHPLADTPSPHPSAAFSGSKGDMFFLSFCITLPSLSQLGPRVGGRREYHSLGPLNSDLPCA